MVRDCIQNDVTILVSSCDLYEDAWEPFMRLLNIQWPDCEYQVVLSTETKKCNLDGVRTVNPPNKGDSWTARLRHALQQVETEYVLWFLEDFFLLKPVDVKGFEKGLSIIRENKDVGLIHYTPVEKEMPIPKDDLDNCYYELPVKKRTLRTRVAVSLFRKDYFLKLLYGDENPWQYERESHIRSMLLGYRIFRQDYSLYPPTFTYCLDHSIGIGITARKWLPNTKRMLEENGILNVNYDRLGVLSSDEKELLDARKKDINAVGLKEAIYNRYVHTIKRKVRHWWLLQDVLNLKKILKYKKYYRKLR